MADHEIIPFLKDSTTLLLITVVGRYGSTFVKIKHLEHYEIIFIDVGSSMNVLKAHKISIGMCLLCQHNFGINRW